MCKRNPGGFQGAIVIVPVFKHFLTHILYPAKPFRGTPKTASSRALQVAAQIPANQESPAKNPSSKDINPSGYCSEIGMPEITEDERGRRVFQIHKGMAVETALEKIRQGIGQDWKLYSESDIAILKYMLGESWVSMDRHSWKQCTFSRLSRKELDQIIKVGKESKSRKRREEDATAETIGILRGIS